MNGWTISGDATLTSVVEEVFHAHKKLPGFQGADIGYRRTSLAGRGEELCLRLHLSGKPGRYGELLKEFAGVRIDVVSADYSAHPLTGQSNGTSQFLTSGTDCSGAHGGGQISLMVADRSTDRLQFLSSWSAAAGRDARIGSPVYERPNPPEGETPIGYLSAMSLDRFGSAALCDPHPDRPWLPIVRPANQVITALKMPRLGERLKVGNGYGRVDGVGIYRVRHEVAKGIWKYVDVEGIRFSTEHDVASGALIYDDQTLTGTGLVSAFDRTATDAVVSIACCLPKVVAHLGLRLADYDDLVRGPNTLAFRRSGEGVDARLGDPREVHRAAPGSSEPGVLSANRRLDIATVIWPGLRAALKTGKGQDLRITDRVERLDALGYAPALIAESVASSPDLKALGVTTVNPANFAGATTFDQV